MTLKDFRVWIGPVYEVEDSFLAYQASAEAKIYISLQPGEEDVPVPRISLRCRWQRPEYRDSAIMSRYLDYEALRDITLKHKKL